jgi:hypothetical protein
MLWKLPSTGSIVTEAEPAQRGRAVQALEGLEIEFGAGGDWQGLAPGGAL